MMKWTIKMESKTDKRRASLHFPLNQDLFA